MDAAGLAVGDDAHVGAESGVGLAPRGPSYCAVEWAWLSAVVGLLRTPKCQEAGGRGFFDRAVRGHWNRRGSFVSFIVMYAVERHTCRWVAACAVREGQSRRRLIAVKPFSSSAAMFQSASIQRTSGSARVA